jgi:molecular chaperone DnaK
MSRVIGIDLGTTNSCVAILEDGQPVVIPNTGGYKTTPSIFAVTEDGKRLVGHLAKRQSITNATNTVYSAKRLIGRSFDSPEVARARDLLPYKIVQGPNNDTRVEVAGRVYTLPEISGIVLREMKRVAEEYVGDTVQQAVITVPAYFNDGQRQTTRDAGRIAGLEVLRIINEPTAAALSYGFGRSENERIVVYDLGGGTFDVSILEMGKGVIEVLATSGDTHLGGEDFDRRIVEFLLEDFHAKEGVQLGEDTMALQRLKDAAEKAKCDLSQVQSTEVNLPFIAADAEENPLHMSVLLTREKLEELVGDLVDRTRPICERALEDAKLGTQEVDQVLLVGGQTRMPMVQTFVAEFFGKTPHKGVNPDEVVAVGAAIQAAMLGEDQEGPLLVDVTPLSLGIATYGGRFARLIERNTTVPTSRQEIFTTTRDSQTAVKIRVLQGESDTADENDLLGEFVLSGIRPAPKGEPEIEVTFDIDANGIVGVSAKDLETNQEQSIEVNPRGLLSPEELEKLAQEYGDVDEEVAVKG